MTLRASIDLGTNTCLLLLGKWDETQHALTEVVRDLSQVVRLGEGVDQSRLLAPGAMDRVLKCLKEYSAVMRELGVVPKDAVCVATSQARDARNSLEFFDRVTQETELRFQVISGEEEARLTFQGALLPGMDPDKSVVVDIGGGSTELIGADQAQSLNMGAVRFTERFLRTDPVSDSEFWSCQAAIDRALLTLEPWRRKLPSSIPLVGVAGTVTTLAAWYLDLPKFDTQKVDGLVLTRGDIHRMVEELKWRTVEERKALPCMEPKRADVILAGALILWRVLEVLQFPEVTVSTRGLRYGVLSHQIAAE